MQITINIEDTLLPTVCPKDATEGGVVTLIMTLLKRDACSKLMLAQMNCKDSVIEDGISVKLASVKE